MRLPIVIGPKAWCRVLVGIVTPPYDICTLFSIFS
jgi:hypothetical protein